MDHFDDLSDEQKVLLAQYKEIVNQNDDDMALATLASLDWDLERAIEASDIGQPETINEQAMDSVLNEETDRATLVGPTRDSSALPFGTTTSMLSNRTKTSGNSTDMPSSKTTSSYKSSSFSSNGVTESAMSSSSSLTNGISHRDEADAGGTSTSTAPARSSSPPVVVGRSFKDALDDTVDVSDDDMEFGNNGVVSYSSDEEELPKEKPIDRIPLIPTDFSSISEAMQNFVAVFESRYGVNHPHFQTGTFQQALIEAFEAPGRDIMERKPLAVYLHNDNSIACNIFAQAVLCEPTVSALLKGQFVTWAWDVTQKENRDKLFEWVMTTNNGGDIVEHVRRIQTAHYPLLVVLVKERGSVQPVSVIQGHDDSTKLIEKLMVALDYYQQIKNKDAQEERERLERDQIRQDQMEEYEKSLAADRARQEQAEKERAEAIFAEREKERLLEEKQQRQETLAQSLPEEPAESDPQAITIRLRFPSGEQKIRRFKMSEPVSWLITFVESLGYDNHRLWTSDVPKKDVSTFDCSKSFAELKWPRREQITVDEK
jgi:hypothetical protein